MSLPIAERAPETPPLPIGYASAIPQPHPERRLGAPVAALIVGLLLLGVALYALLHLLNQFLPRGEEPRGQNFEVVMVILMTFAGICTLAGLLFLAIGLKWLGGVSRGRG
jgi:multisubunit Na+/H+ antiporter MnhB subunit